MADPNWARMVTESAEHVCGVLSASAGRPESWDQPAGTLTWPCRRAIAHTTDCCTWYGALLARRASGDVEIGEVSKQAEPAVLLDALRSGAALLAAAVRAADPDFVGWHSWGPADATGYAGMGCDEILVHGGDAAAGLGLDYRPPAALCEAVLRRLFPWVTVDEDPWADLLAANGRGAAADPGWKWFTAPPGAWDGSVRRQPVPG